MVGRTTSCYEKEEEAGRRRRGDDDDDDKAACREEMVGGEEGRGGGGEEEEEGRRLGLRSSKDMMKRNHPSAVKAEDGRNRRSSSSRSAMLAAEILEILELQVRRTLQREKERRGMTEERDKLLLRSVELFQSGLVADDDCYDYYYSRLS